MKNSWLFFIALLVYSLVLLDSNYGGLLNEGARNYFEHMNIRHSLNLPAALIWVVIGKMLAEKPIKISQSVIWLLLLIASLVYYGEFMMVEHFGWSIHTDCFLTSIPLCTLIFIAIGQSRDIPCRYALWLRKSSIIIYCVHLTLIKLLCLFSAHYIDLPELAIWSITLGLSLVTAFLTVFLCEQKNVKWFKYAY